MHLSQQNLIIYLKELSAKLGRVPTLGDLKVDKTGPSESVFVKNFSSWNNALSAAGLSLNKKHKWSKKELIAVLKHEAKLLGKTPSSGHFKTNPELPSPTTFRVIFGSWNKALKAAGLPIIRVHKFDDKKKLIAGFQKLYVELGRPPTSNDIDNCKYLPSYSVFLARFKAIRNLYSESGIPINEDKLWIRWERTCEAVAISLYGSIVVQSMQVVDGRPDIYVPHEKLVVDAMTRGYKSNRKITALHRYIVKGGRLEFWCISKGKELVASNVQYVYLDELIDRLRRKKKYYWANRLKKFDLVQIGFFSKEDVVNAIRRMARKKKRKPYAKDFRNTDGGFPDISTIRRFFPSFNDALLEADYKGRPFGGDIKHTKTELIKLIRQLTKKLGRTPTVKDVNSAQNFPAAATFKRYFGSHNKVLAAAGVGKNQIRSYTEEELIEKVISLSRILKRTPKLADLARFEDFPGKSTYGARFGTWEKVLTLARLDKPNYQTYSDIELIEKLIILSSRLKHIPTVRDLKKYKWMPRLKAYISHFESFSNAMLASGLGNASKNRPKTKVREFRT